MIYMTLLNQLWLSGSGPFLGEDRDELGELVRLKQFVGLACLGF